MKPIGPRDLQILRALQDAGEYGVYGLALTDKTWRFGSSIHILRSNGIRIKSIHVQGKTWLYVLESKFPKQGKLFQ